MDGGDARVGPRPPLGPVLRGLVASMGLGSVGCVGSPAADIEGGQCTNVYRSPVTASEIDGVDGGDGRLSTAECWTLCEQETGLGAKRQSDDGTLYHSDPADSQDSG